MKKLCHNSRVMNEGHSPADLTLCPHKVAASWPGCKVPRGGKSHKRLPQPSVLETSCTMRHLRSPPPYSTCVTPTDLLELPVPILTFVGLCGLPLWKPNTAIPRPSAHTIRDCWILVSGFLLDTVSTWQCYRPHCRSNHRIMVPILTFAIMEMFPSVLGLDSRTRPKKIAECGVCHSTFGFHKPRSCFVLVMSQPRPLKRRGVVLPEYGTDVHPASLGN